ncbi:uncharacterized protein LOC135709009 [Ochlerotatus camptorhynchus]|uniref:uncharacterized protein LOC135709009 n=1 Tax=Ochlerotatus camptorhynchus TaxID=644619 RepID=UPI0031D8EF13
MAPKETTKKTLKRKATPIQPKEPTKRQRKINTTPKPKKCIQWVNPALNLIQNVAGHPTVHALTQYAHSPILQLPLQAGILTQDTIHRHFEPTSWNITYPVPLITHPNNPEYGQREFIDPILRLVKAKKSHSTTLHRMKSTYSRKKTMLKKVCKGKERSLYSSMVFKVAEQIERDPDRWFSDIFGYDYYFTGGNMAIVDSEKFRCIINTVGEKMDVVEIVQFTVDENRLNVDNNQLERYELSKEHGAVFEICWSETEDAFEDESFLDNSDLNVFTDACLMIAVRRKHKIDVLLTNGNSKKTKIISSEIPFITCCFPQERGDSLLCTSDMNKKLKIWNYGKNEVLHELQLKRADGADDCWTCIRPIRKNYVVCLDRTTIKLFNTTLNLALVLETPLAVWLWTCERASCMEVCIENRFLFIGTTHKLLVIQLVDSQDNGPPEFQQIITFTHSLKHFPTMVKYGSDSYQNYYVWISSQMPGDTTICNFSKVPPKRFATNNLPQKPFTVHESYHLACIKGKCIYSASALKHRLHLFHSGLAMLVDSDRTHLLLQTSFGDIFHQQVIDEHDESNANEIPTLYHSWMLKLNTLNDEQPRPLATDFKSFHGFKKILTCTNIDPPIVSEHPDNPFRKRLRWKQTVEQLHQYKDLLAPGMLSIWGYRPDVTREKQKRRRLSTDEPMDVTDRVASWLDTTAVDVTVTKEHQEVMEGTAIVQIVSCREDMLQSEMEIVEDVKPVIAHDTDVTFIGPVSSSGIVARKPREATKPNRRKYVKGF